MFSEVTWIHTFWAKEYHIISNLMIHPIQYGSNGRLLDTCFDIRSKKTSNMAGQKVRFLFIFYAYNTSFP